MIRAVSEALEVTSPPGSALRLIPPSVGMLAPEDAVWSAMLKGWEVQQLARMLKSGTVKTRVRTVERFHEFTGSYPWTWVPDDVEAWIAHLRSAGQQGNGRAVSTLRGYQAVVGWFCAYLTNPAYQWGQVCLDYFGQTPAQICHEGNAITHVLEYETDPRVRPFTRGELQRFFDFADDRVEAAAGSRRKGWSAAFRDATIFKFLYGYGLRRTEGLRVDTVDFHRCPASPEFGSFGSCAVRYGKSSKGSPPKRRTVLTVFPWTVDVLQEYVSEVRPLFDPDGEALFPTERGGRVSGSYLNARFAEYRDALGLPRELHPHCLRHSYVTHLLEDGHDPYFIQQQVGHAFASTTALYTGVSTDFKNKTLRRALDRYVDPHETSPSGGSDDHLAQSEGDEA